MACLSWTDFSWCFRASSSFPAIPAQPWGTRPGPATAANLLQVLSLVEVVLLTCGKVSGSKVRLCPRGGSLGVRSCCRPHHCCHRSGFTRGQSPATHLFWVSGRWHLHPAPGCSSRLSRALPLPGAFGVLLVGPVLVPGADWEALGARPSLQGPPRPPGVPALGHHH